VSPGLPGWPVVAGAALLLLVPGGILVAEGAPGLPEALTGALQGPLWVSLEVSTLATLAVAVVGLPLAWALARGRGIGRQLLGLALLVPLLMPPLAVGLALIAVLGPATPMGRELTAVGVGAANTGGALFWAEFYEAAPYFVFAAAGALAQVDPAEEEALTLLGYPPWQVFLKVSLPQAAPGLAAALAMGWARAVGAFGAAVVVAYHPTGLPVATWIALEEVGLPAALSLAFLLVLVSLPLPLALTGVGLRAERPL
jgi:molybdate/tungstate transport system permease protein